MQDELDEADGMLNVIDAVMPVVNPSLPPAKLRAMTELQGWSCRRNYFKRKLVIAGARLGDYVWSVSARKASNTGFSFDTKQLVTDEELAKLKQALELIHDVSSNYRENYYKAKNDMIWKSK